MPEISKYRISYSYELVFSVLETIKACLNSEEFEPLNVSNSADVANINSQIGFAGIIVNVFCIAFLVVVV